jgi:hypothetical protein
MLNAPPDPSIVKFSTLIYRGLLAFYPPRFRREFGPHMAQVFRDCCLKAYRRSGPPGMLALWTLTLFDWFKTMLEEQLSRGTEMTRTKFIRMGGWALILGGALFAFSLAVGVQGSSWGGRVRITEALAIDTPIILLMFAHLLMVTGMLAVRARYAEVVGVGASHMLTAAAVAAAVAAVGGLMFAFPGDFGFMFWFLGNLALFFLLTIFGFVGQQRDRLALWNGLAMSTGISSILFMIIASSGISDVISVGALILIGLSLALLGATLIMSDRRVQESF